MKDINQVMIRGRVGNVRTLGANGGVLSLSVVTKESYQDKKTGEWKDNSTWHRVKAFSSRKGLPPFDAFDKGMTVLVLGKLTVNRYEDSDGNERETVEIEASDISIIRNEDAKRSGSAKKNRYNEDF